MEGRVRIFEKAGMKTIEAKVLSYLFENNRGLSRDMERKMDLRQPEVSTSLSKFYKKGWVEREEISHEGKGRPQILFKLKKTKHKIIEELINNCNKKLNNLIEIKENLTKLKEEIN